LRYTRNHELRIILKFASVTFQQEFPIWTSISHIVRLSYPEHNEFATRAGPTSIEGELKWLIFVSHILGVYLQGILIAFKPA
jgi:hypothetical protein